MYSDLILALKGPIFIWSSFSLYRRVNSYIKMAKGLLGFINKTRFPEFYLLIIIILVIYGLAIFFGLSLDGCPCF
jgi:hypothetical protein